MSTSKPASSPPTLTIIIMMMMMIIIIILIIIIIIFVIVIIFCSLKTATDDNLCKRRQFVQLGFILPAQIVASEIKNLEWQEQHKLSPTTICARGDNLWCEVLQNFAQIVADDSLCRDDNLWCNRHCLTLWRLHLTNR